MAGDDLADMLRQARQEIVKAAQEAKQQVVEAGNDLKQAGEEIKDAGYQVLGAADQAANAVVPDAIWRSPTQEMKDNLGIPNDFYSKPAKGEGGVEFINPDVRQESVRIMPGNPNSPNVAQQGPYVVQTSRSGLGVLPNGREASRRDPGVHQPLDRYKYVPVRR